MIENNATGTRVKEKLDFGWKFHKGDIPVRYSVKSGMVGGAADCENVTYGGWMKIAFCDDIQGYDSNSDEWSEVDLPHDWCVEGNYINDRKLGSKPGRNGYLPVGIGCYRKIFEIPAEDEGKRIGIEFDGVFRNCSVWVNGHFLGTHLSGYTGFYYDITEIVRYGSEGKNVVFVKVDAREYEGWWYEGCGIYRHVWLLKTDPLYVSRWGTYVVTNKVDKYMAQIAIKTKVTNEYDKEKNCELVSTIVDVEGNTVIEVAAKELIESNSEVEISQEATISNPKLWSPESPYLYRVLTTIKREGETVDNYETPLGIRTTEFTSDRGFLLNGSPYLIKGTCNHQDFAGLGIALPDSIIEYKIRLLKELGSNAYRSSHHPPAPELLDICDRVGMLVMDENRKLDCSIEGLENLKGMLYRDRNHPCVIIWSMENEEILEGTVMGRRILKKFVDITHKIDPTRPVTAALNHGWNDNGYSDVLDIVGYNYGQRDNQYINDHKNYPLRKIICSESSACTTTRGIYEADTIRGHCPADGTMITEWACTAKTAWKDVADNPFLTGTFIWTGFDYRGEPTPYEWPCINSHFGIMDTCGFPKDIYFYYKSVWTEEPMVHIFPHWNWTGKEGQEINVCVYSNCDSVELFHNGKSLGEKSMPVNSHLEWRVKYYPGELKAVAKKSNKAAAEKIISTTGSQYKVRLDADRKIIKSDGCDVSVVRVSVLDLQGRVVPLADNEITFIIDGPGKVVGVGNGNPSSHEPDKSNRRRAFNGYCLAVVKSSRETGVIRLVASSPGLISDIIEINSVADLL